MGEKNHPSYPLSLKSASSITLLVPPILLVARTANSHHNGTLYSRNLSAVGVTAGMATAGCQRILWWSAGPPSVEGEPGVWWHLAFYGKKLCIRVDIQPYA